MSVSTMALPTPTRDTAIAFPYSYVARLSAKPFLKQDDDLLTPVSFMSASCGASFAAYSINRRISSRRLVTVAVFKSPSKESGSFFESSIVQTELTRIQSDYKALFHLGRNYPLFDREGKLSYIREMQDVLERWQIFHKRMELSDDYSAKLYAEHLKSKVSTHEESDFEMVLSFYKALEDMKQEVEAEI